MIFSLFFAISAISSIFRKKMVKIDFLTKIESKKQLYLLRGFKAITHSYDTMVSEGFYPNIGCLSLLAPLVKVEIFRRCCVIWV
jgi:hypothetical protein